MKFHCCRMMQAWEYSSSDELWAGLIRNLYHKVEERIQKGGTREKNRKVDYKQQWRREKAVTVLEDKFTRLGLRKRILAGIGLLLAGLTTAILELTGVMQVVRTLLSSNTVASWVASASGVVVFLSAAIPAVRVALHSDSATKTSRGDAIFSEAASSSVRDSLGFLTKVPKNRSGGCIGGGRSTL